MERYGNSAAGEGRKVIKSRSTDKVGVQKAAVIVTLRNTSYSSLRK